MSENTRVAKFAKSADPASSAAEDGDNAAERPSIFVALGALIGGPNKKLIVIAGAAILVLLGLVIAAVIVSQMRKPAPRPAPAARVAPAPLQQKQEKELDIKLGIEERFEAIKRGELARIQPNQKAQQPETNVPVATARAGGDRSQAAAVEPALEQPQTPNPGKDPALAGKVGGEVTPGAENPGAPPEEKPPPSALTATGCDVGGSDPKATAAAILACIIEFNAMESRERSRKPMAKKAPPPN